MAIGLAGALNVLKTSMRIVSPVSIFSQKTTNGPDNKMAKQNLLQGRIPLNPDVFPYLVIGLAEWLEQETRSYPYPPFFQDSLNRLSLSLLYEYPQTMAGIVRLFSQPLEEWWIGEYPAEFAPEEPLIEDGALSYEAMNYLDYLSQQEKLSYQDSLARIEIVVDNRKFRKLFERLREKSLIDAEGAQDDYVTLRRFLIEHPYVWITEISRVFSQTKYVDAADVGALYVETGQVTDLMQFPDKKGHPHFWLCERCGPLYVRRGQLESVKPTVCDFRCRRHQDEWQKMAPSRQLRVLRKGIHIRVHLPGIPELQLFTWLQEQYQKHPQLLLDVALWLRIDVYDIQLRFADAVWAIDVKDHHRPHLLGRILADLYREGSLYWDKGFYVYPTYREKQRLDYREAARQEIGNRLTNMEVVSDEVFKSRVRQKIQTMKKRDHLV